MMKPSNKQKKEILEWINDSIDCWHEHKENQQQTLYEYLGWSKKEYEHFVNDQDSFIEYLCLKYKKECNI